MSEAASKSIVPLETSGEPTIGIAFGGGGARGFAHIHIIEVMDELGLKPSVISGASIGSIVGTAYASGMDGKQLREYALGLVNNRTEVLSRFWATRPSGIKNLVGNGLRLGQFNIERILKSFLPEQCCENFEDLNIPVWIVATDFYRHRQVFFNEGPLYSAMAASAAIPALFMPVERDGVIFVDGGIFNPVPYDVLVGKADIIVGVDVVGTPQGDTTKAPSTIESLYGASQLMMQSIIQLQLANCPPDVFVRPPVGAYRVMDFLKGQSILETTKSVRDEFKYKIDDAITAWHTKESQNRG